MNRRRFLQAIGGIALGGLVGGVTGYPPLPPISRQIYWQIKDEECVTYYQVTFAPRHTFYYARATAERPDAEHLKIMDADARVAFRAAQRQFLEGI